jgi:hypothetical protein
MASTWGCYAITILWLLPFSVSAIPSCAAGNYSDALSGSCIACPAGTYQPTAVAYWAPYSFDSGWAGNGFVYANQMCNGQAAYQSGGTYMWWRSYYWYIGPLSSICGQTNFWGTSPKKPTSDSSGLAADIQYLSATNEGKCPPCSPGNYCPVGSVAQLSCPVGSYCSTPSLPAIPCTANSYCSSTSTNVCPGNTVSPPFSFTYLNCTCPAGYYGSVTSSTTSNCALCELGNYCPVGSVAQLSCPVGYSCSGGVATPCPVNSFCSGTFTNVCPGNSVSPALSSTYLNCTCPAGYSGSVTSITTSNCVLCVQGRYCPGSSQSCNC